MRRSMLLLGVLTTLLSAESFSYTEYVRVSSSIAQYEKVQERVPYQECYDRRVRAYDSRVREHDKVVGSILGGAIGGAIGHQIGEGKGNDIATVGGAILGTIVGGNAVEERYGAYEPEYRTKRECVTKYRYEGVRRRFVGYKNIAYYHGRKIVKFSNEKLSTIPITVTISY